MRQPGRLQIDAVGGQPGGGVVGAGRKSHLQPATPAGVDLRAQDEQPPSLARHDRAAAPQVRVRPELQSGARPSSRAPGQTRRRPTHALRRGPIRAAARRGRCGQCGNQRHDEKGAENGEAERDPTLSWTRHRTRFVSFVAPRRRRNRRRAVLRPRRESRIGHRTPDLIPSKSASPAPTAYAASGSMTAPGSTWAVPRRSLRATGSRSRAPAREDHTRGRLWSLNPP